MDAANQPEVHKDVTIWQLMIPIAVPMLIAALKTLPKQIPTKFYPWLAPLIGAAIDILMNVTGIGDGIGGVGAVLGIAGVGVREMVDTGKKHFYERRTKNLSMAKEDPLDPS